MVLREDWEDLFNRWFADRQANPGSVTDEFHESASLVVLRVTGLIVTRFMPFDSAMDLASALDYLERETVKLPLERQTLYSELCRFGRWALCELVRLAPQSESPPLKPRPVREAPAPDQWQFSG